MRRVWIFRFILVLAPAVFLLAIATGFEIGLRIAHSNIPWTSEFTHNIPATRLIEPASRFSLPTSLANYAKHKGIPPSYRSEILDKSHAYPAHTYVKDVFVATSLKNENLFARVIDANERVFDVTATTDKWGRRITPIRNSKQPDRHLIFFGCSNTYGEGVEQEETIPFYTADATKQYRSYNLAISGGSIADAWAYTNVLDLLEDIPEKQGYAFYLFLDTHISRYKGDLTNLHGWIENRPLVRPKKDGQVHFYGRYGNANPTLAFLSKWAKKSYLLSALKFNLPPIREQDLKDFVQVAASVRDAYEKKFGKENPFVFVFYFQYARYYAPKLKPLLEQAGIRYLDYSGFDLEQLSDQYLHIKYDGHPNALAHKIVGELIAEDLKLQ